MTPTLPASSDGAGPERETLARNVARRRIAIACGATAAVSFIAAGLLAGPGMLPGVLDELRERSLLPVHIVGGSGFRPASGQAGAAGSDGDHGRQGGSAAPGDPSDRSAGGGPGAPGAPGSSAPGLTAPPSLILPGGIDLRDVLEDAADAPAGAVDKAKTFVDNTVSGGEDVITGDKPPVDFVNETIGGATDVVNETISTVPTPGLPSLPVEPPAPLPDVPSVPTVPTIVVPAPAVTSPLPSTPIPTIPGLPRL